MDVHATAECAGCEWERHPQAFRWFPELGSPLQSISPAAGAEPTDQGDRRDATVLR